MYIDRHKTNIIIGSVRLDQRTKRIDGQLRLASAVLILLFRHTLREPQRLVMLLSVTIARPSSFPSDCLIF